MINSQTTKNLYRGNGSTLSYPVTYPFYEAENLLVLVAVGEVEETLSLGADYSVAINTDGSGGTVTFTSAESVPAGCTIAIMLNMALVQELDLSAVSHIDTESLEQELDKQVQYIQQMSEGLSRAVKTNATSEISPDRLVSSLFAARDESVAAKNAAETAQASAEAAEASAVAAREATETASASAQNTISEAGAAAAAAVSDAGTAQVSAVNAAGADQVSSVNSAGAAQISSIQSEGATQVTSVTSAGTTQKTEMQALVTAASGYAELAHTYAQQASPEGVVHLVGDETISGVKTFTQTIAGTAAAAEKLATARTITLSGAASGSVSFDGSADTTLEVACMVKNEEFTATNTTGRIIKYNDGLYILYANIDYAKPYDGITYFYFTFPEAFSVIQSVYITNCNKEIYYGFTARITTATNIRIDYYNINKAIVYATTSSGDPKREFYSTDDFSLNLLAIGTWK